MDCGTNCLPTLLSLFLDPSGGGFLQRCEPHLSCLRSYVGTLQEVIETRIQFYFSCLSIVFEHLQTMQVKLIDLQFSLSLPFFIRKIHAYILEPKQMAHFLNFVFIFQDFHY